MSVINLLFLSWRPSFSFCNNGHNNVNLSPLPVGTMLNVLSVECWRDPAWGRSFSSCFQGAPLSELLQCAAVSSISPWIASPRRQLFQFITFAGGLPVSSTAQGLSGHFHHHMGHCHTLSNKVWVSALGGRFLRICSFLRCSVSAKKIGAPPYICSSCIL